jgi:polygalacturonase
MNISCANRFLRRAVWLCTIPLAALAQDRRTVVEPKAPPICTVLRASLTLQDGRLTEKDESRLDTDRIQQALNACREGSGVELAADGKMSAFLIGPVQIPAGRTLIVRGGATVMGSRDPRLYDVQPGSCGVVNYEPPGCKPMISVHDADHVAIMGEGVIDGRGGETLLGTGTRWWDLAEKARAGGRQQVPRLIVADDSNDFVVEGVTLRNSPNFHLVFGHGHGFTVWDVKIDTPRSARNTDGIDPGGAKDITVKNSFIRTGDDNVAIKGGEGGVAYMTVEDNHFYSGHGMSIGSETFGGVHDILVKNLTLDGADNGIRIKSNRSRGGVVERITYSNICMRNVRSPIVLDTQYNNPGPQTNRLPVYRDIHLKNVSIAGGGRISVEGIDANHRISVDLDGVKLDNPGAYTLSAKHARIAYGPGDVNFRLAGEDVAAKDMPGTAIVTGCNDAVFVPFSAQASSDNRTDQPQRAMR